MFVGRGIYHSEARFSPLLSPPPRRKVKRQSSSSGGGNKNSDAEGRDAERIVDATWRRGVGAKLQGG